MFLLTMFHTDGGCKLVRKVFNYLNDAEEFCDYHYNIGWVIFELAQVDTTLSDAFEMCEG